MGVKKEINEENYPIESGTIAGKKWIKGVVPVGKGREIYLNTKTGEGVETILKYLNGFVTYQASKARFPAHSKEDIVQEINLLAIEAIPKYDPSKKSNMLTFLQNHIKNRLINLCKYVSEKRRRATYYTTEMCKIKCPKCKGFTKVYQNKETYVCGCCGYSAASNDVRWRKYNLPLVPIPFGVIENAMEKSSEGSSDHSPFGDILSDSNDDLAFIREISMDLSDKVQKRVDFMNIYNCLEDVDKSIVKMVIEGRTYKEIADVIGISEKAAYARASKIIKHNVV